MLTALSVARDCHMVAASERVILVQVLPSMSGGAGGDYSKHKPLLQWTYAEDTSTRVREVITTTEMVSLQLRTLLEILVVVYLCIQVTNVEKATYSIMCLS